MDSNLVNRYQEFIKLKNLKSSKRRDFIFNHIIKNIENHFTIDDIYNNIMKIDPSIGIATIYRTVRLLVESGLIVEHSFREKKGFFEIINHRSPDHGHLICLKCGKIKEFECSFIDDFQTEIGKKYHFGIRYHKLEIYGVCDTCQKNENGKKQENEN